MKHLLFTLLLLFSFSGCGEDEAKAKLDAKLAQETQNALDAKVQKDALLAELKAKDLALEKARKEAQVAQAKLLEQEQEKKDAFLKEQLQKEKKAKEVAQNKKLSNVGINIDNNKITIDTDKTKSFFENLGKTLETKITKLTKEIETGIIHQDDAGVHIDKNNINIDLNKTKDFLELWGKKMQSFVKDFDTMAKEIDTPTK